MPKALPKLPKQLKKRNRRIGTRAIGVFARILRHHAGQRHILLVRQRGKPAWTLPGGKLELGESIEEGLARELKEEIGVRATLTKHKPIRILSRESQHYLVLVFDATITTIPMPAKEITEAAFFPLVKPPSRLSLQARAILRRPAGCFQTLLGV